MAMLSGATTRLRSNSLKKKSGKCSMKSGKRSRHWVTRGTPSARLTEFWVIVPRRRCENFNDNKAFRPPVGSMAKPLPRWDFRVWQISYLERANVSPLRRAKAPANTRRSSLPPLKGGEGQGVEET